MKKIFVLFIIYHAIITGQEIQLNEIVSSNGDILYDEDGETPDWIEIYNNTSEPKNLFGYGITERFSALKPYLHNHNIEYSHPHNDIFAGFIASGVAGGIAAFVSIISTFLASLFASNRSREKVLLGLMLSISSWL